MRLRTNLFLLVAGAVAPLLIVTAILSWILVAEFQDTVHRSALDRNRAFMSAVDAELRGHVTTLHAVSASASLERGDLNAFGDELRLALTSQPTWLTIFLSDATGRPVSDPYASADLTPGDADPASLRRAIDSAQPSYGNVARWNPSGSYGVAVRWPVRLNGRLQYVVTAVVDVEQFQRLIVAQKLPPGWRSGVVDCGGRFVARVPARPAADSASPDFLLAVQRSPEGWYRGRTVEGDDTFTAHVTSEASGWSLGLAIPVDLVFGPAVRAAWATTAALLATLVIALGFAYLLSRRIANPILQLAEQARGERLPAAPIQTHIVEIGAVAKVIHQAQAAAEERERLLERERAALLDADRSKDEFLAMLGHELRNPLSAIAASTRLLRANPKVAARDHALSVLARQTQQMAHLVDDLLEVSRLTMGKVVLARETFDLHALASSVASAWLASERVTPDQIKLTGEPAWIDGDRGRIEQVLSNLIDNAAKFGGCGGEIHVHVGHEDDAIVMEIRDRGPGIPVGSEHRIFDRFEQGPQGLDRAAGGLGLGLAIVRQIVTLHGGSVEAANRDDAPGACFTVKLQRASAATSTGEAPANVPESTSFKMLVVEDLVDVGETVAAVLASEGHEVRLALGGEDAIRQASEDVPDVVLLDIGLPDIPGYEVARRLRATPETSAIIIIALTGYGSSADERRAIEAGCDMHLRKPFDAGELLDAISRLCNARGRSGGPR